MLLLQLFCKKGYSDFKENYRPVSISNDCLQDIRNFSYKEITLFMDQF